MPTLTAILISRPGGANALDGTELKIPNVSSDVVISNFCEPCQIYWRVAILRLKSNDASGKLF